VSFFEAIQDWWESRDVRKIRKRRRIRALKYLKKLDNKKEEEEIIDTPDDEEEKTVTPIKRLTFLKDGFFIKSFQGKIKWSLVGSGLLAVLILFMITILFSSNMFSISTIEYEFNESIFINNKLLESHSDQFLGDNMFLFQVSNLSELLYENFPSIEKIEIDKGYPKSLIVKIQEYKPAIILRRGQLETNEYLVNHAGYVIAQRPYSGPEGEFITVLSTDTDMELSIGDRVMKTEDVEFIYTAVASFEDKVGIPVISIWWLKREKELHMWTQKYFKVMMTFSRSVDSQIQDMIVALQDLDLKRRSFEYIDLRVADKVFVKPR
jgi:cell division septal protein FtsQ